MLQILRVFIMCVSANGEWSIMTLLNLKMAEILKHKLQSKYCHHCCRHHQHYNFQHLSYCHCFKSRDEKD